MVATARELPASKARQSTRLPEPILRRMGRRPARPYAVVIEQLAPRAEAEHVTRYHEQRKQEPGE
jgi:hypothetical protein